MSTIKRKWSEAQKLQIIQEAEQNGVTETMRKHNLAHSVYRKWRKAYNGEGMAGLQPKYKTVMTVWSSPSASYWQKNSYALDMRR